MAAIRPSTGFLLKNIRMASTRFGWLFVIIIGGMLLGSINYNNNLGFLVTFLLCSMALVSIFHTFRNVEGIQIQSVEISPVFARQVAIVHLKIDPGKSTGAALGFSFKRGGKVQVNLTSGRVNRVNIPVPAEKRGLLSLGVLRVYTEYPLGLFYFKARYEMDLSCIVYPTPRSSRRLTIQDLLQVHAPEGIADDQMDDFKGLRHFQTGDSTRRIFWKVFSKGQGLMVKEFEGASLPSLFFSWEKVKGNDLEDRLSRLCGMILKAGKLKLAYGMRLPGKVISPDKGENHKHRCLRALALF